IKPRQKNVGIPRCNLYLREVAESAFFRPLPLMLQVLYLCKAVLARGLEEQIGIGQQLCELADLFGRIVGPVLLEEQERQLFVWPVSIKQLDQIPLLRG